MDFSHVASQNENMVCLNLEELIKMSYSCVRTLLILKLGDLPRLYHACYSQQSSSSLCYMINTMFVPKIFIPPITSQCSSKAREAPGVPENASGGTRGLSSSAQIIPSIGGFVWAKDRDEGGKGFGHETCVRELLCGLFRVAKIGQFPTPFPLF